MWSSPQTGRRSQGFIRQVTSEESAFIRKARTPEPRRSRSVFSPAEEIGDTGADNGLLRYAVDRRRTGSRHDRTGSRHDEPDHPLPAYQQLARSGPVSRRGRFRR